MQYPRNIFEQFTKIKGDIVKKKNVDAAFELADTIQEVALPERTNMTTLEILL